MGLWQGIAICRGFAASFSSGTDTLQNYGPSTFIAENPQPPMTPGSEKLFSFDANCTAGHYFL